MKVKSDEEATGVKKIKIFENLGISTGYNFAAEKFKMANISVNTQTNFLEGKISVNSSMQIDPYKTAINPQNLQFERIDQLGDFRVTNFNVQASVPINRLFESKENKSNNTPNNINPNNPNNPNQPINPATTTADSDKKDLSKKYKERGEIMLEKYYFDEDHYAQFGQTWTLNANTQFNYSNNLNGKGNKTASLGLDGSLQLTPHWALNGSAFYDVVNGQISYSRIGFARNLRSFSFTLNWVPTGQYKVYDFFISIKASILRDAVKYNTRSFQRNSSF